MAETTARQRKAAAALRAKVTADLTTGIEADRELYDAWGGAGFWRPKVKLFEREAVVVADYVDRLVREGHLTVTAPTPPLPRARNA